MLGNSSSPGIVWRKSSYSGADIGQGGSGNCLEVAALPDGMVGVRDSKNPGPVLRFTPAQWHRFCQRFQGPPARLGPYLLN